MTRPAGQIDLHTHSTCSDGTDTPAELVAAAQRAGLAGIALTDHDTFGGWEAANEAARRVGLVLVPGVEISCERDGRSLHLLGYLVDPLDVALTAELDAARESRVTRLERMVTRMAADGIPVSYEQVLGQVPPGATPGRPHIADALVASGVVPHRNDAFGRWLHDESPYYVRHYAPDPIRAVQLVRAAGGVPVLAHPFTAARGRRVCDGVLEEAVAAGLAGIEVHHPDHDESSRRHAAQLVARYGLIGTGASDYHGTGKVTPLGAETSSLAVLAEIASQASGSPVIRG